MNEREALNTRSFCVDSDDRGTHFVWQELAINSPEIPLSKYGASTSKWNQVCLPHKLSLKYSEGFERVFTELKFSPLQALEALRVVRG
jgi:hypothetical protein